VIVFLETTSRSSPVGVLSLVEKDGKEVLGLKVSSQSSGGAWPFVGGALSSFAEMVRSKGPIKLRVPLVERRDLDLLPVVRPTASEEVRLALGCSVMKKEPQGKDLLLKLQGKEHPVRFLSTQGTPRLARKTLPHLNLCTWRKLLVRMMGQVVGLLMGRSFAFVLGLKPTFSFKGFHLGRVMTKPKSKKRTEVMGQGLPLDPEAGFEFSLGFGSTSGLQRPKVTTAVDMGGGLSTPTNSEMSKGAKDTPARPLSFPPEGAGSCLNTSLAADLSLLVSKGFEKQAVEVAHSLLLPVGSGLDSSAPESSMYASSPVQSSVFPGMSLSAISGPVSAFSGSPFAIGSFAFAPPPEAMSVPFGCSNLDSEGFSPALDFSEIG
jgi:hypothetical protein